MTAALAPSFPRAALVLGSGGARGAYEVGVARFLFEDLARALGHAPRISILCGTSAGALNAVALAAYADNMLAGTTFLWRRWMGLDLGVVVRPDRLELLTMASDLLGCPSRLLRALDGRGSLLDPRPLRKHVMEDLPFERVDEHVDRGRLDALSLTATEVATGRTVMFVRRRAGGSAFPPARATVMLESGSLRPDHVFASAAIPLIFLPVLIDRRLYCDGSLRQSVPLSPAIHLGADAVVAVSTQHIASQPPAFVSQERERASASPAYLLGKAINALTLDSVAEDIERLRSVNDMIAAGERAYGARFLQSVNPGLGQARTVKPVRAALVRPSESIGRLAAEYVRSRTFEKRAPRGLLRTFRRLAEGEAEHEADLLSYLLFDGPFATELMGLGHADARRQERELRALFEPGVSGASSAPDHGSSEKSAQPDDAERSASEAQGMHHPAP